MSESSLSKAVCELLRLYKICFFHVPSEGRRTRWEQMQFKANGGTAGISDLVIVLYQRVVFVELKSRSGRQGPAQKEFKKMVEALGHQYQIWKSIDDALAFCKDRREIVSAPDKDGKRKVLKRTL